MGMGDCVFMVQAAAEVTAIESPIHDHRACRRVRRMGLRKKHVACLRWSSGNDAKEHVLRIAAEVAFGNVMLPIATSAGAAASRKFPVFGGGASLA
jgi:hypothetical protein